MKGRIGMQEETLMQDGVGSHCNGAHKAALFTVNGKEVTQKITLGAALLCLKRGKVGKSY